MKFEDFTKEAFILANLEDAEREAKSNELLYQYELANKKSVFALKGKEDILKRLDFLFRYKITSQTDLNVIRYYEFVVKVKALDSYLAKGKITQENYDTEMLELEGQKEKIGKNDLQDKYPIEKVRASGWWEG